MIRENAIIEEAENTSNYEPGLFGHAEFNLVHKLVNKYPDKLYLAKEKTALRLSSSFSFGW
ncbi:hypothetical protein NYE76_02755 [Paenibacillus sp. FSL M7-0831]|nr:hypothetical protein PbDSM24746_12250 [Paenibacillus macerans]GBK67523.1 hypothetical protein PbJCM17693_12310 [Paenibacillus macerans]GIP09150.1 hypothetical protein J1TS5_13200 [Paenibacillus macerans]